MPIEISVGKRTYQSTDRKHSEEVMFESGKYNNGDFTAEMTGWPCTGERHHNCHDLFKRQSKDRTITVIVEDDHGGYAKNHGKEFGATGTITYVNGIVEYS
ncbi:hypothetical protein AAD001_08505 [Colwelliaceae bacterium 6471]